jgi:hypothetical protein
MSFIFWGATFLRPKLASSEALLPIFFALLILSYVSCVASVLHFGVARKLWDVIICLAVNSANMVLILYGCLWCFSLGLNAWH